MKQFLNKVMKQLFYNKEKAEKEAASKELLASQQKEELLYLEKLMADPLFQKYIVEKRIKARVAELSDLTNIPSMTPEALEREVTCRNATIRVLKDIFSSIIN